MTGDGKKTKAVLLNPRQIEQLERIRDEESMRSALGIRPTIHEVARRIIDEALNNGGKKWQSTL